MKQTAVDWLEQQINESQDDLKWIRDVIEFNPWNEYDFVFFDKIPTKENIESLVDMSFNSGRVNESSKKDWVKDKDEHINDIIKYFRDLGKSYMKILGRRLYYGATASKKEDYNWVPYSQLF